MAEGHHGAASLSPVQIAQVAKYLDSVKLIETAIRAVPPHPEGVLLTHVPEFCVSPELEGDCATAYLQNITECVSVSVCV